MCSRSQLKSYWHLPSFEQIVCVYQVMRGHNPEEGHRRILGYLVFVYLKSSNIVYPDYHYQLPIADP